MLVSNGLTPLARALRLFVVWCSFIVIASIVIIACSEEFASSSRQRKTIPIARRARLEIPAVQRAVMSGALSAKMEGSSTRSSSDVNVETSNLTVVLEHVEVDSSSKDAPWMFTYSNSPFVEARNGSVFAHNKISWNADGSGNGTCSSKGSGKVSRGYLDPYNYYLGLNNPPDFEETNVELHNLTLSDFLHINTVDPNGSWNKMGAAGDTRRYSHGHFKVFRREKMLLSAKNVQWVQNLSYPGPIGEAKEGSLSVAAYFVAEIQRLRSDEEWVHQLDPNGVGYLLGVLTAASFGPTSCFSSNSYWVTVRGFPDFTSGESAAGNAAAGSGRYGNKVGTYEGSSERAIATARVLAGVAKAIVSTVVATVVSGALAGAATSVLSSGALQGPPGQGLVRLLGTAAFVAKVNEIHGFHSDAMAEFGEGLKIFIGKTEWPFTDHAKPSEAAIAAAARAARNHRGVLPNGSDILASVIRQDIVDSETSVSDELFGGCAFYTTLIVIGFLCLHGLIWLATRKKPWQEQLVPHAWMIYLFSIVMSHVYRAAVLNSMQYMRSHIGAGTGKAGLYVVAVLQLLLIGVGFTAFFVTVMVLAMQRVQRKDVRWIPKQELADPDMRQSTLIAGEYQANDSNAFHTLFECYYSSLAGPRLWLAALELGIVFLDAICTAVIWNEVVCLALLVCVYAFLFALFLVLGPFVDRVEGTLVVFLGLIELVLLIMDFLGALGDYDAAEKMEFGAMILGFVGIGIAVVIAIYCDLIPIVSSLWSAARRRFRKEMIVDGKLEHCANSDLSSEWSGLSRSNSVAGESTRLSDNDEDHNFEREEMEIEVDEVPGLVAYNAEREKEVQGLLSAMFDNEARQEGVDQGLSTVSARVVIDPRSHDPGGVAQERRGHLDARGSEVGEASLLGREESKDEIEKVTRVDR